MKAQTLLFCLALTLVGCGSLAQQAAPTPTPRPVPPALEKPTYAVERGTVVDQIQVNGRVSAVQQEDLSFAENGFVKTVYVKQTSVITTGELLAELELGDLPNQMAQAKLERDQALISQQRASADRDLTIRRAELDLADARALLATLQNPDNTADLTIAQAAVAQASAAVDVARTTTSAEKSRGELDLQAASDALWLVQIDVTPIFQEWERIRNDANEPGWADANNANLAATARLREAEAVVTRAKIALDAARKSEAAAIREAETNLATAQARLAALTKGATASAQATARRQIERAELNLEAARRGADPELEKRLASAKLSVERIQSAIDAKRLYAPFDGKVAALSIKPGTSAEAYKSVMRVIDPGAIEVLVDQAVLRQGTKLGIGMAAEMVFVRYRANVITGTLERLPSAATSSASSVNADTGYHLSFDSNGLKLEIGDLVEVTFILSRKQEALWLPPQAIRTFEGRRFVVIRDGDRQRRADVKVGIISDDRVEILNGVKAGDVIVGQ